MLWLVLTHFHQQVVIKGHIHKGAYLAYKACHLLQGAGCQENDSLEPEESGWEQRFGTLLPSKCMKALPPEMSIICKCSGKCDTIRCGCISAGLCCVTFCHGKSFSVSCWTISKRNVNVKFKSNVQVLTQLCIIYSDVHVGKKTTTTKTGV